MAKQITFKYDNKEYILEFNREVFKKVEASGITMARLEGLENNPADALEVIPELWFRAFQMHHPSVTRELADEIYHSMANKGGNAEQNLPDEEIDFGLLGALIELYQEPVAILYTEQGNTKWSKSW